MGVEVRFVGGPRDGESSRIVSGALPGVLVVDDSGVGSARGRVLLVGRVALDQRFPALSGRPGVTMLTFVGGPPG